jgi:hypothetical protein
MPIMATCKGEQQGSTHTSEQQSSTCKENDGCGAMKTSLSILILAEQGCISDCADGPLLLVRYRL